jgi:hypothetical protein
MSSAVLSSISIAAAKSAGVGVKGGIPFNDVFEARGVIGGEPFHANTQRFTVAFHAAIRRSLWVPSDVRCRSR